MVYRTSAFYNTIKTRATFLLLQGRVNDREVPQLRDTQDRWLINNTVTIALLIARDETIPLSDVRRHFNKAHLRQARSEIKRDLRLIGPTSNLVEPPNTTDPGCSAWFAHDPAAGTRATEHPLSELIEVKVHITISRVALG